MSSGEFHDQAYDPGTLTKLKIFELYVEEWIPVFVSRSDPPFSELHIFDLFSGPGTDASGIPGSPLRILRQLRAYQTRGMAGWSRVNLSVHLSDADEAKILKLQEAIRAPDWQVAGVSIEARAETFEAALKRHAPILRNPRAAKLLIIDQFGVDAVKEPVFTQLITSPRTDFIFFLSSSTLNRFHDHPAIRIRIDRPEHSYDVHRAAFEWYERLKPAGAFLGKFSIKKGSNIYGLIFGTQHPLGAHKFLEVAWANDEIRGEANFDIDREDIAPGDILLPMPEFRPQKIQAFEAELAAQLRARRMLSEADLIHFCISEGMTCQHANPVLQQLKAEGVLECDFRTPQVKNISHPRSIHYL